MANSKVQLADGTVLIDLTEDTVSPETLVRGATAHDKSGNVIVGIGIIPQYSRHISFLTTVDDEFDVTYGYISYGESVSLSEVLSIDYISRIQKLRVVISGENAENIILNSTNWTITRNPGVVSCEKNVESWLEANAAIENFIISADTNTPHDKIIASIQVSAITDESSTILADGATHIFVFYGSTWEAIDDQSLIFNDVNGLTWRALEAKGKNW